MPKKPTYALLGAAGLIGRALTDHMINTNCNLILCERDITALNAIRSEYKDNESVVYHVLDINDESSVHEFIHAYNFDGLVNCTYPKTSEFGKDFYEISYKHFNQHLGLHLGSTFILLREMLNKFKITKSRVSIVLIGSIYGVIAPKFDIYEKSESCMPVEYAVIKSGLIHLAKYVSKLASNSDFRVNVLSPGGVFDNQDTNLVKNYTKHTFGSGMLNPSEIAPKIHFLLSSDSSYINGQNIVIDDGYTL